MHPTLRGRPPLIITLETIVEAVRRHSRVMRAAPVLGCSAAYIHGRLKRAGMTLVQILNAEDLEGLVLSRRRGNSMWKKDSTPIKHRRYLGTEIS